MQRNHLWAYIGLALLALSAPASAHVSLEVKSATVGAGYKAVFSVPHGCEGSPTKEVIIDIPEGVIAVKPMPKPGWALSLQKGAYKRSYAFYHGSTKSEGVRRVTWSGGDLPDEYFDQFVLSTFIAGELAPGTKLSFTVTQKCADGELRWHEVAAEGRDAHSLEHPAPQLLLVADEAGDGHHHNHGAGRTDAAAGAAPIVVATPWTRPASAGGMGVGYATITNEGAEPDTLLGASSDAAESVQVHETTIDDKGVASMKKLDAIEIKPGNSIELKPAGMHVMFIGLKQPLTEGGVLKAKLKFKNAGDVDVDFAVRAAGPAAADGGGHEHMHHQH